MADFQRQAGWLQLSLQISPQDSLQGSCQKSQAGELSHDLDCRWAFELPKATAPASPIETFTTAAGNKAGVHANFPQVRHLAQSKQYADSRRYGRLLVIDAFESEQHLSADADMLVSVTSFGIFCSSSTTTLWKLLRGKTSFLSAGTLVLCCSFCNRATPTLSGDSFLSWIASC